MIRLSEARREELEDEQEFTVSYPETPLCVYQTLKDRARGRVWIGYEELNQACQLGIDLGTDPGRSEIGNLVGAVSEFEVEKGRPMLSAVVVRVKSPREPGKGFYDWADELKQRRPGESDNQLWIRILQECHDYWSKRP